jgi:soluble lytic murein transglycosylase
VAWLLERYDGVFPLAAAAYNAGEHRVDRWIRGMRGMPMDVWIETIPFSETRNYVKNVLAFNQVYGMLLDEPVPILEDNELTVP